MCEINPENIIHKEVFGDTEFVNIDITSVGNNLGEVSFENKLNTNNAPSRTRRLLKKMIF